MKFTGAGFTMFYEDRGEGIPLLLIHGYPLNCQMWQPQLEDLSDIARVIAPDLRGHGDSSSVPGAYSMELLAKDCAALLDYVGISQPIIICGLSMGGYVAMAFFRMYPSKLKGLILASTRAGADSPEVRSQRSKVVNQIPKEGIQPIASSMSQKLLAPMNYLKNPTLVTKIKSMIEMTSMEGIRGAQLGMMDRFDSHATLKQIEIPTLVIHGHEDQIVPLSEAEEMKAEMKYSKLVIISHAGHLPNLEQPAIFNQAVREYLMGLLNDQKKSAEL